MSAPLSQLTLECMVAQLRRGTALVEAALAALEHLRLTLAEGTLDPAALRAILRRAAVDGDNLLVATPERRRRTAVFTLARSADGHVRVQTMDLDAAALLDGISLDEVLAGDAPCLRHLGDRARAVASALSIARARLDLQASFLDAVLGAQAVPAAPTVPDATASAATTPDPTIRALALAAGRQLGRERLPLAARNRRTLEALFTLAVNG